MTKLSKIQFRCLKVASKTGKLRRCDNGEWSNRWTWVPSAAARSQGKVFKHNTVQSLERRGLLEPSEFEMRIYQMEERKVSRLITESGRALLRRLEEEERS